VVFLTLALVLHGGPQFWVETFDSVFLAEHLAAPERCKGLILATFACPIGTGGPSGLGAAPCRVVLLSPDGYREEGV
jgi:hypothetical protein